MMLANSGNNYKKEYGKKTVSAGGASILKFYFYFFIWNFDFSFVFCPFDDIKPSIL